jgi:hypothetical protein
MYSKASLQFTQPGFYKDHGYASAEAASDEVVYGRMYLIRRCTFLQGA